MSRDPQQYARFSGQRLRPALDLIARIPIEHPRTVVDLGCGTGNVTQILRLRWPHARVTGVDGSPQLLAEARKVEADIAWEQIDVAAWNPPEKIDLIFSNAALHWLDDHPSLFARLCANIAAASRRPMPGNRMAGPCFLSSACLLSPASRPSCTRPTVDEGEGVRCRI